ncbi:hypothetical protein TcBrA4_0099200 [Trypanosoma cruzi]|nr:hypothetical protein TcBrA4_0099200 [Trypanosoma cruzi]
MSGRSCLFSVRRDGSTDIKGCLQSAGACRSAGSGQEDVNQSLGWSAREWRCSSQEEVTAEAAHRPRSQQHRSTADPRGQGRGAAMPRGITGLGSTRQQAVSHGPLAAR